MYDQYRGTQALVDSLAPRGGMKTYDELVRWYLPGVTPDEARTILWEMTAHPCSGLKHTVQRLREIAAVVRPEEPGWRERLGREQGRIYAEIDRRVSRLLKGAES